MAKQLLAVLSLLASVCISTENLLEPRDVQSDQDGSTEHSGTEPSLDQDGLPGISFGSGFGSAGSAGLFPGPTLPPNAVSS